MVEGQGPGRVGSGSGSCPSEWGRLRPAHSADRWGEGGNTCLPRCMGVSLTASQGQEDPAHPDG